MQYAIIRGFSHSRGNINWKFRRSLHGPKDHAGDVFEGDVERQGATENKSATALVKEFARAAKAGSVGGPAFFLPTAAERPAACRRLRLSLERFNIPSPTAH